MAMMGKKPEALRPGEQYITCPDCFSYLPAMKVGTLSNWVIRDGRLVEVEGTGKRVSCQACGCCYSIGPQGTFRQHPQSLPQVHPVPQGSPQKPPDGEPRPPRPMPKEAPRI